MRPTPKDYVFLSGAHFDQIMRLNQPAVMGVSNPAKIENIPGGSALNSASTASALGLNVTLLSPIGDDLNGQHLLEICKQRNIRSALIQTDEQPTGNYTAIFEPLGDIVIGASDLAIYNVIDNDWIKRHLSEHLKNDMGLFLNANLEESLLLASADKASFLAAATISPAKARRLLPILGQVDCLFTNLGEARILSGLDHASAHELAAWAVNQGASAGTISQGADRLIYWHDGEIGEVIPQKIENLMDVNGAGDALAGAVIAALAFGKTFPDAVSFANQVAAYSLTHNGPFCPKLAVEGPKLK